MSCNQLYSIISLHVIQDLDQTGLVFGNDAEKLFAATMHKLIGRKGDCTGLPAVKEATEQAAAAVRAAERTKGAYHAQYCTTVERCSNCSELVSAAKCCKQQAKVRSTQLQAVQLDGRYALLDFCESCGHHM